MKLIKKKDSLGLLFGCSLIIFCAFLGTDLYEKQKVHELSNIPSIKQANVTAVLGVTLLGGFRGLLVDLVWIRMRTHEENGQYTELLALADIILELQPNLPSIWVYQGWTMAYNVSVQEPSQERRWLWIESGIKKLEEGALKHPDNFDIKYQIANTYFFRIPQEDYFVQKLKDEGKNNYEEAYKWYLAAAKCKGARSVNEMMVVFSLKRLGRSQEALRYLREVMSVKYPESIIVKELISELSESSQ